MHTQVSGLVNGVKERLRFAAANVVIAHVYFIPVRTSLYLPPTVIALPNGDRLLTHLVCTCDPSRACAGGSMRSLCFINARILGFN